MDITMAVLGDVGRSINRSMPVDPKLFLLLLPVPVGALFVIAAIKDWNFFFESGKANRGLLGMLSRPVKRVVYAIGGALIILACVSIFYMAASAELSRS